MHRTRTSLARPLVAAAAALAVLAACSSDASTDADSTATTAAAATTSRPTTTADDTDETTATTDATTTTEAATTTAEATTTTEPGPPVYPLTGLLATDPTIAARQALVVKIDNASGARPQTGFNAADIVFEEIVNDSLTRFAMVFQSGDSDPVGPVRSGRVQDIDLFGMFNHPLFAWSGGNATVTAAIRASDLVDIGPSRARVYFRSRARSAPHNLYSTTADLRTQATPFATPPTQQFQYRAADAAAAGTPSVGVEVVLDSINAEWLWDAEQGLYLREMEGRPHQDAAGGQVSTNNVVVLGMEYLPGISGSPDAQSVGSGEAWVFTGGHYIHGNWTRDDRLKPFTLLADDGTEIRLTPGRTFIELPRAGGNVNPLPAF